MVVPLYTFIGDHSSSNSEKWSMKVGDKWHSAPDYGVVQRDQRQFKRGEAYPIELRHDGSNRAAGPDYDYRAWVDKYANPAWTSGATTISGTDYFAVDTNSPALMQKRWFGEDQNNSAGKTATLVIPGIDLDVDTANDDGFGTVYDNAAEDRDEELTTKGKYVVANTGDLDSDGVIDNVGFNGVAGHRSSRCSSVFLRRCNSLARRLPTSSLPLITRWLSWLPMPAACFASGRWTHRVLVENGSFSVPASK